jgi:hypothetical protein
MSNDTPYGYPFKRNQLVWIPASIVVDASRPPPHTAIEQQQRFDEAQRSAWDLRSDEHIAAIIISVHRFGSAPDPQAYTRGRPAMRYRLKGPKLTIKRGSGDHLYVRLIDLGRRIKVFKKDWRHVVIR